ncbi:MAG: hypothetical protein EXR99_08675 [Gemmataceae bacterium]|nr:hypothetical protein [Gemmataceae bacterium]
MTRPTDLAAITGAIPPADRTAASTQSDVIDLGLFHQAMFILQTGSTDATVDFKLQESASAAGSFNDIPGKAIAPLGPSDDNRQAIIEVDGSEVKRFVRAVVTGGAGTVCLVSLLAIGLSPRFGPARDNDAISVSQIVF